MAENQETALMCQNQLLGTSCCCTPHLVLWPKGPLFASEAFVSLNSAMILYFEIVMCVYPVDMFHPCDSSPCGGGKECKEELDKYQCIKK